MPGGNRNIRPEDNPKPFVKGDPRCNRNGRPPSLETLINKLFGTGTDFEELLTKGMDKAKKGDIAWARELLERTYGKVKQDLSIEASVNLHFDKQDGEL